MGFRFRRSLKIAPGIRLNFSKRGVGVSLGVRGARVSLGADGKVRRTVGLPGTGLSYTTTASMGGHASAVEGSQEPEEVSYAELDPQLCQGSGSFLDCVVGEPTYLRALQTIAGEHGVATGELDTVAALTLDHEIVAVVISGRKVGRISKDQSTPARQLCQRLAGSGKYPTVRAKVLYQEGGWQVLLDLP